MKHCGLADLQYSTHELNTPSGLQYYEVRISPYKLGEVLLIVRNVTEAKDSEIELIQRNFELDSFVYRASHDLKSPLNSIMGLIGPDKRNRKGSTDRSLPGVNGSECI